MNRYFTPKPGTSIRDASTGKTYVTGDLIDGSTEAGLALVRANRWKMMGSAGRGAPPGPARETRDLGDIPGSATRSSADVMAERSVLSATDRFFDHIEECEPDEDTDE